MKKCDQFLENILLYFYDELPEEQALFESHLQKCPDCRGALEEEKKFQKLMNQKTILEPTKKLLDQCRTQLSFRLRKERSAAVTEKWWEKLFKIPSVSSPIYKLAGAAALLIIGIIIGRFVLAPTKIIVGSRTAEFEGKSIAAFLGDLGAEPRIRDVEFIHFDPGTDEIEVRFDAYSRATLKGKLDEEPIRRILAYALKENVRASTRLKTVQALSAQPVEEEEVLDALLYALEHDQNPGVRLKVIQALINSLLRQLLKNLPVNDRIKRALINTLLRDTNAGIRIEAMEALSKVKDKETLSVFKKKARFDENNYVRLQAQRALAKMNKQ